MQLYFNKNKIHKITRHNDTSFFVLYNQGYGFKINRQERKPHYWIYMWETSPKGKPLCDEDLIEILDFMNKMKFELIIEDSKSKEFWFIPAGRSFPIASLKTELIIEKKVAINSFQKELDKLQNIIADLQDENLTLIKDRFHKLKLDEQKVMREILK
jgi:hypothetical protein